MRRAESGTRTRPPLQGPRPVRLRQGPRLARLRQGPRLARLREDRGQVTIEFTVMGPIILLTLALLWQAVLVGYTFVLAGNAADKAVRACAVGADYQAAGQADLGSWEGQIGCDPGADMVTATADVEAPLLFPGGPTIDITVHGESTAVGEQG